MTYTHIPGESHTASEEETLSMIRAVLAEDSKPKQTQRGCLEKDDHQQLSKSPTLVDHEPPETQTPEVASRKRDAFAELDDADPVPTKGRTSWGAPIAFRRLAKLAAGLRAFRPTTRQLAIVSTLLLVVVRPYWFVLGIVLIVAAVAGVFLFLGEDRIWAAVLKHIKRVEAKDSSRAAVLSVRLDTFADHWDRFLDYFPEGVVARFYMPDFQSLAHAEERHAAAVSERLTRLHEEG